MIAPNPRSPAGTAAPTRGYLICSEHRSGSTLLCQWLAATGVLGHPREYFATTENAMAIERDPTQLDEVLAEAATANGVWGMKLFSQQFDNTLKARWIERLPGARFIHLERRDLLGQAISMTRALQTGQYLANRPAQASAHYDARTIRRQLGRLAEAHARWRLYFARNGIDVLWLVYEDMLHDPDATVRAVADHAGVADPPAIDPRLVNITVQRDELSAQWRTRFLAETADLRHLDHPLGRGRVWARRVARDVGAGLRRLR